MNYLRKQSYNIYINRLYKYYSTEAIDFGNKLIEHVNFHNNQLSKSGVNRMIHLLKDKNQNETIANDEYIKMKEVLELYEKNFIDPSYKDSNMLIRKILSMPNGIDKVIEIIKKPYRLIKFISPYTYIDLIKKINYEKRYKDTIDLYENNLVHNEYFKPVSNVYSLLTRSYIASNEFDKAIELMKKAHKDKKLLPFTSNIFIMELGKDKEKKDILLNLIQLIQENDFPKNETTIKLIEKYKDQDNDLNKETNETMTQS